MQNRFARWVSMMVLGVAAMAVLTSFPLFAAGDKKDKKDKKKPPATTKYTAYLLRVDVEGGGVKSVEILIPTPKGKFQQDIKRYDINSKTEFILIDGEDKSTFDHKTVVSDPKGKAAFIDRVKNDFTPQSVTVEAKGKVGISFTITKKAKKDAAKDKKK